MEKLTETLNAFSIETSSNKEILESHSKDWSLFKIMPSSVVFPKNAEQIGEVIKEVSKLKQADPTNQTLSVTARAAGTDMTGGPLNQGVIIDVSKYLNKISLVEKGEFGTQTSFFGHTYQLTGKAIAQPGVFYRDFEKETLKQQLEMPCYPASKDIAALGGMVANNGAGEKSLKYGQNKDFVKRLKVVLHDGNEYEIKPLDKNELDTELRSGSFLGNLYKQLYGFLITHEDLIQSKKPVTSKNAAGYLLWDILSRDRNQKKFFDPTKLFVGSQGTLGIVTEIEYVLTTVETRSKLLVVFLDDLKLIPTVVTELMKFDVEMLEMYDDNTFKIGVKFFKDFLKDKGFFGSIKYGLRFIPEVKMVLTGGIPKIIILAEFLSNNESELEHEAYAAEKVMNNLGLKTHVTHKASEEEKFWDFRHDSFKLLTEHSKETRLSGIGTRTAPFIDDIAVNPEFLPEYLPKLMTLLNQYNLLYTIAGHLGNGNFHIIPLMDMKKEENRKLVLEISDKVYELALQYKGSITAEHNDGIIRTPYLEQQFGSEMIDLFKQVKQLFDPLNIFNPGKKVGGTKGDIEKWME